MISLAKRICVLRLRSYLKVERILFYARNEKERHIQMFEQKRRRYFDVIPTHQSGNAPKEYYSKKIRSSKTQDRPFHQCNVML